MALADPRSLPLEDYLDGDTLLRQLRRKAIELCAARSRLAPGATRARWEAAQS